jgi:PAS domain S-box-containing protein
MKLTDKLKTYFKCKRYSEEDQKHYEKLKESEASLREGEERFRSLFDNSADGILLTAPDGEIFAANVSACRMLGRSEKEICQAGRDGIVDMSDPRLAAALEERRNTGKLRSEYFHIRKDGTRFPCEVTSSTFNDKDGNIRACTIFRDITERKQAQEALQDEKEKLLAIINATTDKIFLIDTDGIILAINGAASTHLGLDPDRAVGATVFDGVTPEIAQKRRARIQEICLAKQPFQSESKHQDEWIDTFFFPVVVGGKVARIVVYGRDITARKVAEEALKKNEKRYRSIFENAMEGIFQSDTHGRLIRANPALAKLYGYDSPEDMIINVTDIPHQLYANQNERKQHRKLLEEHGIVRNFEHEAIRKDGSKIWVSTNTRIVHDATGNILYYEGTVVADITSRKKAEEALKAEWEKYQAASENARAIVNATTDAIYLFNTDGVLLAINEAGAARLKIDFETAAGTNVYENVLPETEERRRSRVNEVIHTKKPMYYEADQRGRWYDTCLYPVITNETVTGIALYGRDITDRKLAEEELKKYHEQLEELVEDRTLELKAANKELESFSYSVSHDLRSPLRAIDGFSRILSEEHAANLSQEAQRYIGLVRTSARQMGKLIDDLLTFSRLSRQPLAKQSVAPADIVRQVLEQLHYMQEGRHIKISIGDLPVCQSDPSLLKVVYTNLLSNALKFTGKRDYAIIEIGCNGEGGEHVYYVKDNGVGFNMKYVEKLFGVFQRLHRANEYEGTGVGLANVQRIIHRHGGRIWVTSEMDKGTVFYFTFEKGGKLI